MTAVDSAPAGGIGFPLTVLRERAQMAPREVAKALGIPTRWIEALEAGDRTPTPSQIHRLASLYADAIRCAALRSNPPQTSGDLS